MSPTWKATWGGATRGLRVGGVSTGTAEAAGTVAGGRQQAAARKTLNMLPQYVGPQVRPVPVGRDAQGEGQHGPRVLRRHDRIHEAACRGEARIELVLVVGAHRLDRFLQLLRRAP